MTTEDQSRPGRVVRPLVAVGVACSGADAATLVPRSLTVRERQVLELISEGRTTQELSALLRVSTKTVANHKRRLFARLGVHTQAQAVAVAVREGLVGPLLNASTTPAGFGPTDRRAPAPHGSVTVVEQWQRTPSDRSAGRRTRGLTQREHEVVAAMADGLSTKEIGRRLGVAAKTVEGHKTRVFGKLDARSQAHAVRLAITHGLLAGSQAQTASTTAPPTHATSMVALTASVS